MRKIFIIAVLSLMALPVFGAVSYSRTPAGTSITSPVSISASVSDISKYEFQPLTNSYNFFAERTDDFLFWSDECFLTSDLSVLAHISIPVGTEIKKIGVYGFHNEDCTNASGGGFLQPNTDVFTIISGGGIPSLFSVPMASSSDMVASVGTLFTDLWVIIAIVIGIPLAFYIIQRVIALPPKDTPKKYEHKYVMHNIRGDETGYWKGK
jgi:hypothetical protein